MKDLVQEVKYLFKRIGSQQFYLILLVLFITYLAKVIYLKESYAWGGWSPVDWTARVLKPQNFASDFPSGVENYRHSLVMWVYPFLEKYFSVPAMVSVYISVFIEMVLTCAIFIKLYDMFTPKEPKSGLDSFAFLILCALVLSSSARYANAGFFPQPFFAGLYYSYADWFRGLAIIFCLTRKPLLAGISITLAYTIHPGLALQAGLLCALFVILSYRDFIKLKQTYLGIFIASVLLIAWTYINFDFQTVNSAGIPKKDWIELTRLMNFHWYPVSAGMFSDLFQDTFIPLISLFLSSFFICLAFKDYRYITVPTLILVLSLTLFGWFNAEFIESQTLIKISFQRSTNLLYFIFLPLLIYWLLQSFKSGDFFTKSLCLSLLASLFLQNGLPILPLVLLYLLTSAALKPGISKKLKPLFLIVTFLAIIAQHWTTASALISPAIFGSITTNIILVGSLAFLLIQNNMSQMSYLSKLTPAKIVVIFTLVLASIWSFQRLPRARELEKSRSFLQTQLWAKEHTPYNALFFVDPTILYGWRDFSDRSSFGNLREWVHTSWLYTSTESVYREGLKRFGILGIDLKPYLNQKPIRQSNYFVILDQALANFYNLPAEKINQVSSEYGISYLVLQQEHIHQKYNWPKAYENDDFVVYKMNSLN